MVRVGVLGPLHATVGGTAVDPGGPRQRAVLARLVRAGGHVVSTDRLIDDLWRGEPPPKALAALQVYVSHLRRLLEPDRPPRTPAGVLVSVAPGYALRLEPDDVDAWRFESLLADAGQARAEHRPDRVEELVDAALGLWTGPAYAEFVDDPWAAGEANRLDELRAGAVELRAQAALDRGRHLQVVPALDAHVQEHPLREEGVRLLALALYRAGRQGDALAVLRRTRQRLVDELGVDPGPALRALETDVLAQAPHLAGPAPALPPAAPPTRGGVPVGRTVGELDGRDVELAALLAAGDQAATGGLRVRWVGGEAGAGKTTLVEAVGDRLRDRGWQVAVGRCPEVEGGAPPAWAWSEVVRGLSRRHPIGDRLADRLAPLLGDGPPGGGQFWLARAVGAYLAEVAAKGPLLVLLDDVHRADCETLQVLRMVAAERTAVPMLVVGTYRPAEFHADLDATLAALAGPRSDVLDLGGLDEASVGRLLRRYVGAAVDPETVRAVTERTGGNPLFVCETARLIVAEGPAAAVQVIPSGIRNVLRRRISRLPASAVTVLRGAAVIGRDVDVDVLLAADPAGEDTVFDGLEAGVLTGLLVEPAPGRVRFTHALIRDALYEDTPRLRRTRMHGRVLSTLEQKRPDDLAALAYHALAAGPTAVDRAVGYAAGAARRAAGINAHLEAAELWTGALAALDQVADADPATRVDLLCGLASAQSRCADSRGARATRQRAVAAARPLADPVATARALVAMDAPVTWTIREARAVDVELVATIERTLAALPARSDVLRSRLLSALVFEIEGDDPDRADQASTEALRLARAVGDLAALCVALNARYFVDLAPRRFHRLPALGAELLEVARAAGLPGYESQAHHILFQVALDNCELAAAGRHVDQAIRSSTLGQLGPTLAVMSLFDALRALVAGEFDEAERGFTETAERLDRAGVPNALAVGVAARYFTRLAAGRVEQSLPELAPLYAQIPQYTHDLMAGALLAAGRPAEARAVWRPDLPVREDYYWLLWTGLRAQVAVAFADRAVADGCYTALLPWAGRLAGLSSGSVTGGPVDHALGELAVLLGRPERAAEHFAAAGELATRLGADHWAEQAATAAAAIAPVSRR
ncbi:BTAD domain-containing putative transcriptional regulator [Polymorphospora sp. NPDC051019]|uniref:BTAD domain-containing putative transcriptional regulator n=1 Tax=Polymorphospora sp. NPDC051019 TaxID=3155725 RepID=UPI00343A8AB0